PRGRSRSPSGWRDRAPALPSGQRLAGIVVAGESLDRTRELGRELLGRALVLLPELDPRLLGAISPSALELAVARVERHARNRALRAQTDHHSPSSWSSARPNSAAKRSGWAV